MDGDVSASATATPPAAPDTTSTAPAIAPQLDSAPAATGGTLNNLPATANPADKAKADSWGAKVYHGVLNALGGSSDVSLARDPQTGKMVATAVKSGPGQQWKRIISGALTGAAAGNAAEPGRGFGAGEQAVVQRRQANADRQRQQANEDFEVQQKTTVANAQNALLSHQIAQAIYNAGRAKIEAAAGDAQRETDFEKLITDGGAGSTDMGIFPDFDSVMKHFKDMPEMHDHQAGGRIAVIPHINDGGMIDGVHAALVTPTWQQQKYPNAFPITQRVPQPGGGFKEETYTIPPNSYDNDTISKMMMTQASTSLKESIDKAEQADKDARERDEEKRTAAENALSYASAGREKSETVTPGAAGPASDFQADAAEGLASGRYMMGKDFPTRTSKDQVQAGALNKAANEYSMAHYVLPYSPEIIRQESHAANQPKVQAFLSGIDRMIGTPGMPGQLDQVLDLAKRAGLGNTAPLNSVSLWVREHLGTEAAKNFETGMSDTQTALGTLIGNPLLGSGESDLKLKTAQRQFGSNPTIGNLRTTVATTKEILNRARGQLARNNRYIQQRYGDDYSPAPRPAQGAAAPQGGAAGPTTVTIPPGLPTLKTAPPGAVGIYPYGGQNYFVKADGTPLAKAE
jgi:hypothetical protein